MRIGIVRTANSPCRCAESVSKGLETLGHEFLIVDSEEITLQASALAGECDLVIDHTDTFYGRGLYRSLVRMLLEDCGAHIVGSNARACFLADNKAAAKARLAKAGIPVPPGIAIQSKEFKIPSWLKPPLVLKPVFEHMSRGVSIVHTLEEAYSAAAQLLELTKQPVILESFIPGRELAVSLLSGSKGLQALPILEWGFGSGETGVLTEEFKLMDPSDEGHRVSKANLPKDQNHELEAFAQQAFHVLGLRDYARFDVRLSSDGTLFFLEANTTPSLEPLEAFAVSASWAGLDYPALVDHMLYAAQNRFERHHPVIEGSGRIMLPTGPIELEIAEGMHRPPDSTIELASLLDIQQGEKVLELGCGSGLLSIAAAKLGAGQVVSTDLDVGALQSMEINARKNGVADRICIRAGAWYEALGDKTLPMNQTDRFDVIIATPPQTPGPQPFGPKYGGLDGTVHLLKIIENAPKYLSPEKGRLWLMTISLVNQQKVWKCLQELFSEVVLVHQTERLFTAEEYEKMANGLFDHFCSLQSSGISDFYEIEKGRYAFRNLFIRATGPRNI
jgi:D-alanine-D-alanine ligase-like ATP-grasp enzyme/methylase of polypeptide subunit release factors